MPSDLPVPSPTPQGPRPTVDPYPDLDDAALRREAEALGADLSRVATRAELLAALDRQRRLIASLDERTLTELVTWAGLTPPPAPPGEGLTARKERLARAAASLKTMRFAGLSADALRALCVLRSIPVRGDEPIPLLIDYLKARESLFEKLHRKRRGFLGAIAEKLVGAPPPEDRSRSIKHEIEDQGLLAGVSNRLKRQADTYLQEKLDEIEARIDRKLDEIDNRLSDWRDKEIANRIRILKITLWASVVISALSLLYLYAKTHLL